MNIIKREWLIAFRKSASMTQQEVADKANIERAYYTQIETGQRNPSVKVAKQIATALEFNWAIFFEINCSVS